MAFVQQKNRLWLNRYHDVTNTSCRFYTHLMHDGLIHCLHCRINIPFSALLYIQSVDFELRG